MQPAPVSDFPSHIREVEAEIPLSREMRQRVEQRVLAEARDGRLPCAGAIAIARSLGVPSRAVGQVADGLRIKIAKCQLGCF